MEKTILILISLYTIVITSVLLLRKNRRIIFRIVTKTDQNPPAVNDVNPAFAWPPHGEIIAV